MPAAAYTIDSEGWARAAEASTPAPRQRPSPNCDARPPGVAVDLVVIHNISLPPGVFDGDAVAEFFLNRLDWDADPFYEQIRGVRVSAHFLVRRDGSPEQFVSCDARAWHAGASRHAGRERCNDFSVGIELEGTDTLPFTDAQYATLAALIRALCARYPIAALAGHEHIAPGRKTDPGPAFDWPRLQKACNLPAPYFP
jgi:N-acetyl-anhydromuramoyl-L-alanine amidase